MDKFVAPGEIARLREQLVNEHDETRRQTLLRLLAEEQAKLSALKNDPPKNKGRAD